MEETLIYDKLIDTDVLIWYLRGDENALSLLSNIQEFCISSMTYMELVQGMKDKRELKYYKKL